METWNTQFKPSSNFNDINTPAQNEDKNCQDPPTNPEQLIEDFSSYTTLHGFHFILDAGSLWRRLIWIILVLAGLTFLIVQIWLSVHRLNAKEVAISKSVEVNESLPFPAVTICNQNFMKKSKIMGTVAQDYLDQMDFVKFQFAGQKPKDVPSFDVGKKLQEAGHRIDKMIHYCTFAGFPCDYTDFISVAPSFYNGLCYSFNVNSIPALKNVNKGKYQGLQLRLNVEAYEYYGPYSYDATGFRVAIHEPGAYHMMDEQGYDVSAGFYTSMRIRRKKTISMPPPFRSECGSKKLFNFERYTQKSCLFECWSQTVAKEFKCRLIGMPEKGINITRYCNNTEIWQYTKQLTIFKVTPVNCGCPLECESIEYNIQTSMAYYPSKHLMDTLIPHTVNETGLDPSYQMAEILGIIRRENVILNVFFENLRTDITEEKERYGISNFGSDIGGNMGLFLGCSLLTIFEFFDLIVRICVKRWIRRKAVLNSKTHNDQNGNGQIQLKNR